MARKRRFDHGRPVGRGGGQGCGKYSGWKRVVRATRSRAPSNRERVRKALADPLEVVVQPPGDDRRLERDQRRRPRAVQRRAVSASGVQSCGDQQHLARIDARIARRDPRSSAAGRARAPASWTCSQGAPSAAATAAWPRSPRIEDPILRELCTPRRQRRVRNGAIRRAAHLSSGAYSCAGGQATGGAGGFSCSVWPATSHGSGNPREAAVGRPAQQDDVALRQHLPVLVPRRARHPPAQVVTLRLHAIQPLGQAEQARRVGPA